MYRTSPIHSYHYQPLVTFNPPVDTLLTTEKEIMDRSYNFNFSKELPANTRLMLSRK
jgi:hypothetical protein